MTAGTSVALRQEIADKVKSVIESNFKNSFPGVKELDKIVMALIYTESRFNTNAIYNSGSPDKDFLNSSAYTNIASSGDSAKLQNMYNASLLVYGLGQVRGSYFVKGGSRSGKCEIERIRPDLAASLCVAPGGDVASKVLGKDNIGNAITSILVILQDKFNNVPRIMKAVSGGYSYRGKVFGSRIEAAVGSYLGLGVADRNHTTPTGYAQSIVNGDAYRIANNSSTPAVQTYQNPDATQVASGPTTNSSGMAKQDIVGCG